MGYSNFQQASCLL